MLTKIEITELADKVLECTPSPGPTLPTGRALLHNCVETAIEMTLAEVLKKVPYVTQSILDDMGDVAAFINSGDTDRLIPAMSDVLKILKQLSVIEPKTYSVLLLCPNHATNHHTQDTYLARVLAASVDEAVLLARRQAHNSRQGYGESPDDYFVSLVCEGHINDIKG